VWPITSAVWATATAPHATFASDINLLYNLDGIICGRRLLSSAEIFPFEGSYGASALQAAVPGLHLLVVCRGGQLFAQLQESTEPLQGYRLVAVLRSPVSCDDSEPCLLVHCPHGTRRLVLVLAARSAGAERLKAHVRRVKPGGMIARGSSLKTPTNQFLRL